ncbi:hypothetical protein ACFOSC_12820 [Streptantibioticus rubrisoli]|uniref:Aminoacyl-transfer RNA synthetases class-II family profile domain-containing protein n=1 Tax=Streptantibioticus rubrisoli TaxID=1387313 RepID=A0ABT1PB70_9ACTN|nr:hypothetical protein [Streptantibioticus rubrisoli]MCQ4041488.1 hypothetical protein [Streptantibioticus rubrisoli]
MQSNGLAFLRSGEAGTLARLDRVFEGWGLGDGAEPVIGPPLLPVAALAKLDYYQNFPHQALLATPLDLERRPEGEDTTTIGAFPPERLAEADVALPSAACYAVYLGLEGTAIAGNTLVTLVGRCFRKETRYSGLRRLLGFHMREVVALGSREFVEEHIDRYSGRVLAFAEALDLPLRKEVASDPFYDGEGPRALFQTLSPVKYEFLSGDLAIGSVNRHRNFFGERCAIRYADTDEPVFTSCAAFGLERWLSVLHDRHRTWEAAMDAIDAAEQAIDKTVERTSA